jgi:hypothetical protein
LPHRASESAGRPERGFAGGGPEREIRHARQCLELHVIDGLEAMHYRVEQGAEDERPRDFEFAPKLGFRAPVRLRNRCQSQKDRPIPQIWSADHILYAVQQDRARCFKQHLLIVGI